VLTDDGNVYIAGWHEAGDHMELREEEAFSSPEKVMKAVDFCPEKSVIWSLGCILLNMITKLEPNSQELFPSKESLANEKKFSQNFPKVSALYDRNLQDYIHLMMRIVP